MKRPLAVLVMLLLAASPAFAGKGRKGRMRTLDFSRDVKKERAPDMEAARASRPPEELRFSLDGAPWIEGEKVRLKGVLENPTDHDVPTIVFPVVNWASPFYLELKEDEHVSFRPPGPGEPPLPPPAPPPPMRFVAPAHSRIAFEAEVDLHRYTWTSAPEAEFRWKFLFWNPPKPEGSFRLVLPKR